MREAAWLSKLKRISADLSIRNKLFIAFLLLNFIPLAIIGTLTYQKSNLLIQEKTNDYTIDLLSEVSKNIELNLREIDRLYYAIFTNPEVRRALMQANTGQLSMVDYLSLSNAVSQILYAAIIDRDDVENVHLISLNGQVFQTGDRPFKTSLNRDDWDQIISNKGDLIWINLESDPLFIAGGSSIYDVDNLKKIGYFILDYKKTAISKYYNQIKLIEQGDLYIIDQNGQIISHENESLINSRPDASYIDRILGGGKQGNFAEQVDGRRQIITYQQIGNMGWKIISVIPAENYLIQSLILKNWMLLIFLSVFVLAILLAYCMSNGISRPIRQLSEMMKHVERDRLDVSFHYHSRNEIGVLSRNFNRMIERISYLINQVYQEELLKQRSQLKYLMFQINPHFLFNTLETINWLARIQGAPDVGRLSKALGDLMREAIKGKELVTLDREITNVNKYVYIQNYRYADKFHMVIEMHPDTLRVVVPRFILQPLVENAIVHGLELKMGQGTIAIRSCFRGDQLVLSVTDEGQGIEPSKLADIQTALSGKAENPQTGIGLLNVHQRIQLHYGKAYGLSIQSIPGSGTFVQLTLPGNGGPGERQSESST
ncbi:sensor histidine kinase [Paenibacillus doosanensis]|uniref:histidine kinase n=1 Tax=Paenibacillus konkukensis TaxID=2020716 RepID=A0ABY4RGD2_9BACL|nr:MULTISPECIES: sensor histidine kinase [Paenibacillus]MCS7461344.1 sensor histidine kinase [Paenibacillus doosanensis]UQZ81110.1 Sensor histidine kinase YpdA [Paenibacillus konkukensis]